MEEPLTTRELANEITESLLIAGEIAEWQVRRLFEDGTLPEPPKFGGKRMISRDSIPRIIEAMRARGWLPRPADSFDQIVVGGRAL